MKIFTLFFLLHKLLYRVIEEVKSLAATVQYFHTFPILSFVKELETLITSKALKKALFCNEILLYNDSTSISNISLYAGILSCERETIFISIGDNVINLHLSPSTLTDIQ